MLHSKYIFFYRIRVRLLCFAIVCIHFFAIRSTLAAQDDCTKKMSEVRYEFLSSRFGKAIDLINNCLQTGKLSPDERIQAYELLALAYFEIDDVQQAKKHLKALLKLDPEYVRNVDPLQEDYKQLVNEARIELEREKRSKWWIVAGAGALAGAVAAFITLGSSGDDGGGAGFSPPPGRPPGN